MIHFMAGAVRSLRLAPAPAANYPTARRRARGRRNPRANDARRLWPRHEGPPGPPGFDAAGIGKFSGGGGLMRIKCGSCGKVYDYDKDELCPKCGAHNQLPRAEGAAAAPHTETAEPQPRRGWQTYRQPKRAPAHRRPDGRPTRRPPPGRKSGPTAGRLRRAFSCSCSSWWGAVWSAAFRPTTRPGTAGARRGGRLGRGLARGARGAGGDGRLA